MNNINVRLSYKMTYHFNIHYCIRKHKNLPVDYDQGTGFSIAWVLRSVEFQWPYLRFQFFFPVINIKLQHL